MWRLVNASFIPWLSQKSADTSGGAANLSRLIALQGDQYAPPLSPASCVPQRWHLALRRPSINDAGGRRIDVLTPDNVAIESKSGRTSLNQRVREELAKDKELMTKGFKLEWHFTKSPLTGLGGPSGPLRRELERAGIKIVVR